MGGRPGNHPELDGFATCHAFRISIERFVSYEILLPIAESLHIYSSVNP